MTTALLPVPVVLVSRVVQASPSSLASSRVLTETGVFEVFRAIEVLFGPKKHGLSNDSCVPNPPILPDIEPTLALSEWAPDVRLDEVVPTIADREVYDGEAKGFSVLVEVDSTHSNLPIVYYKRANVGGLVAPEIGVDLR